MPGSLMSLPYPATRHLIALYVEEVGIGIVFSAVPPYPTLPDVIKEPIANNCDHLAPGKVEMGHDPATNHYVLNMWCKTE